MTRLILTFENSNNVKTFLDFIEQFDFIRNIEAVKSIRKKQKKINSNLKPRKNLRKNLKLNSFSVEEMMQTFGIWKDRY